MITPKVYSSCTSVSGCPPAMELMDISSFFFSAAELHGNVLLTKRLIRLPFQTFYDVIAHEICVEVSTNIKCN